MTKRTITFTKNTSVIPGFAHMPGLEIEISYRATCELVWDADVQEHDVTLQELQIFVNGVEQLQFEWPSYLTRDGRAFLAFIADAARDALYHQTIADALADVGYPPKSFVE